jgi:hypothetical protein
LLVIMLPVVIKLMSRAPIMTVISRRSSHLVNQILGVVDAGPPAREDASVTTGVSADAGHNHSVAADPVTGHVYVPIPSNSGSTICSSAGGSDTQGCIAVFTTPNDDCFAQGMPTRGFDDHGNAQFEHERCRDHDHHEAFNH